MPKEGDLRVWHIPQVPGEAFHVSVGSLEEAIKIVAILIQYDLFQFMQGVKPDYCNANGLEVFEDGEWWEWLSEDGEEIDCCIETGEEPK